MERKWLLAGILVIVIVTAGIVVGVVLYRVFTETENFLIEQYDSEKVSSGTTLFADLHNLDEPRIVEVNMAGEIVWEYILPDNLKDYTNPGLDVELLPNNNVLFVCPLKGVFEVNRNGTIVWSYLNSKVSHDALKKSPMVFVMKLFS